MPSPTHSPNKSIIAQQAHTAQQLFLLFHGVGARPESMLSLAQLLCEEFPDSTIVSVVAPHACDLGAGYQWFSVRGVTEENRPQRVQEAMPLFVQEILYWQAKAGIDSERTALIGFSQGGIMVLEAGIAQPQLAARIIAHSGRFAMLPNAPTENITLHLIHGKADDVIPYRYCIEAADKLQSLGSDFTADGIPHLGHSTNQESLQLIISNLKNHLPRHNLARALETGVPASHTPSQA